MEDYVRFVVHYGGKWVRQPDMVYVGGSVAEFKVDVDKLSYFELRGECMDITESKKGGRLWFKIWGLSGDEGFEEIESDINVRNMLDYNKGYLNNVLYFVENEDTLNVKIPEVLFEYSDSEVEILIDNGSGGNAVIDNGIGNSEAVNGLGNMDVGDGPGTVTDGLGNLDVGDGLGNMGDGLGCNENVGMWVMGLRVKGLSVMRMWQMG